MSDQPIIDDGGGQVDMSGGDGWPPGDGLLDWIFEPGDDQ